MLSLKKKWKKIILYISYFKERSTYCFRVLISLRGIPNTKFFILTQLFKPIVNAN
jgi:hypothetical protein